MLVYVVSYTTEPGGDTGIAGVFSQEPTERHLTAIVKRDFPHEIIEADGEKAHCLYFEVQPVTVTSLPKPARRALPFVNDL